MQDIPRVLYCRAERGSNYQRVANHEAALPEVLRDTEDRFVWLQEPEGSRLPFELCGAEVNELAGRVVVAEP